MRIIGIGLTTTLISCAFFCFPFAGEAADVEVFFIHHSTGEIYRDGGMKTKLENNGYDLRAPWWDGATDYNDWHDQLSDPDSWDIIGTPDVLMFKSCYPNSDISSKAQLNEYKKEYRKLYDIFQAHPDVLFIPWSTPPLPRQMTSKANAKRAKKFDKWLKKRYISDYNGDNLDSFRLFYQLTGPKHWYMKRKYVSDPYDGHPKSNSGKRVGKKVLKLLNKHYK